MVSKVKVDAIESTTGSGTIALNNQFSGMSVASLPTLTTTEIPTLTTSHMPASSVVNTWAIGMTSSAVTVSSASWTPIGCSGNISVTAGNKLFVQMASGIYVNSASTTHFSMNVYFNGASLGDPSWGLNISHGNTAYSGWFNTGSVTQTTIASTGTYTIELKAKSNTGSITFGGDGRTAGGFGYDCPKMLVWEIKG